VDFTVLPDLFQQAWLAGLAVDRHSQTRRDTVLLCIIEQLLQAWKGAFKIIDHLTYGFTSHPNLSLITGQMLHGGRHPNSRHNNLSILGAGPGPSPPGTP
jgi:hypothetical protein